MSNPNFNAILGNTIEEDGIMLPDDIIFSDDDIVDYDIVDYDDDYDDDDDDNISQNIKNEIKTIIPTKEDIALIWTLVAEDLDVRESLAVKPEVTKHFLDITSDLYQLDDNISQNIKNEIKTIIPTKEDIALIWILVAEDLDVTESFAVESNVTKHFLNMTNDLYELDEIISPDLRPRPVSFFKESVFLQNSLEKSQYFLNLNNDDLYFCIFSFISIRFLNMLLQTCKFMHKKILLFHEKVKVIRVDSYEVMKNLFILPTMENKTNVTNFIIDNLTTIIFDIPEENYEVDFLKFMPTKIKSSTCSICNSIISICKCKKFKPKKKYLLCNNRLNVNLLFKNLKSIYINLTYGYQMTQFLKLCLDGPVFVNRRYHGFLNQEEEIKDAINSSGIVRYYT